MRAALGPFPWQGLYFAAIAAALTHHDLGRPWSSAAASGISWAFGIALGWLVLGVSNWVLRACADHVRRRLTRP